MKKSLFLLAFFALFSGVAKAAAPELTYNGEVLPWNTEWQRAECGTLDISANIMEVSGIACSRVTPGYIWMQSDEYESYIIATDEKGEKRYFTINFTKEIRGDWEDLSGGVYGGKNYLFIGAFGDNDESWGDYSIVYIEEPAIDLENPAITMTPNRIKFVYPDGKKHNCEALMYDNKEQMLYIVTKVYYDVCQVFSLPFRLDYGDATQTLTYICDLGLQSDIAEGTYYSESEHKDISLRYKGFHLVTGADISPDGKYILIKNHNNIVANYSWILLWERDGEESISETLKRQPQPLSCYNYEWQGEAICWLDDETFYTTSDSDDGNPPIYKYTKAEALEPVVAVERHFTIDGDFEDWADLKGLAHATVSAGAEAGYDKLYDIRFYADQEFISFYIEANADDKLVGSVDILLNVDGNPLTGHNAWQWETAAADYLIEGYFPDLSGAKLYMPATTDQSTWSWDEGVAVDLAFCFPVTLANGHAAVEARIAISKFPTPVSSLNVGVFTSDENWDNSGCLPAVWGPTLEVPIYSPATGIETSVSNEAGVRKVLRNGQLYIMYEGQTYDVRGARVGK